MSRISFFPEMTTLAGVKSLYIEFREDAKPRLILLHQLFVDLKKIPTYQNVLKYVSISCKISFTSNLREQWLNLFELISELHSRPIIVIENVSWIVDKFNKISKMFLVNAGALDNLPEFFHANSYFLQDIKNSCLIDLGFVTTQQTPLFAEDIVVSYNNQIERPYDSVSFVEKLQQGFLLNDEKALLTRISLCPEHSFELRYNRGIMQNFNAVIFTLCLNWKFCRHSTLWGGWWARLPREILNYILGFLHPMQWKLAEAEKPRKRFAVKTPKYANDILKQYKELLSKQDQVKKTRENLDSMQGEEERVRLKIQRAEKKLEDLREELSQVPLERLQLQNTLNDAQRTFQEEKGAFAPLLNP